MNKINYNIDDQLKPFVNCIMEGNSTATDAHTNIPLYADGYPGIMFQHSQNGFYLLPKKKKLSELFLYGQTLNPVALNVQGPYRYLVVQLYPFASKYLLNIDPKLLNDECYNLLEIKKVDTNKYHQELLKTNNLKIQTRILSDLISDLITAHSIPQNDVIQKAISIIIKHKGQIKIQDILKQIYLTERTFERNFSAQVGLSPKQFGRIIQFQFSLNQLNTSNLIKLTQIGLDSGFSDQSHFIRTFKKYTGQTPSHYLKTS
ncbi:MAG: helix-turn-helix transcriptional regulator [Aureispira sp.]|nr:helix-turn-helix transcriptional regulator [Aureispira sp.]